MFFLIPGKLYRAKLKLPFRNLVSNAYGFTSESGDLACGEIILYLGVDERPGIFGGRPTRRHMFLRGSTGRVHLFFNGMYDDVTVRPDKYLEACLP